MTSIVFLLIPFLIIVSIKKPLLLLKLLLLLSTFIPTSHETSQYFSIKLLGYHFLFIDIVLGILIIGYFTNILLNNYNRSTVAYYSSIKKSISLFLIWVALGMLRGLINNYNLSEVFYDTRPLLYFLIIIIAMKFVQKEKELLELVYTFLVGIGIYLIFTFVAAILGTSAVFFIILENLYLSFNGRIAFQNDLYLLIIIPLSLLTAINLKNNLRLNLIFFLLLVLSVFQLAMTMSRGLLFLTFVSVFISIYYFFKQDNRNIIFRNIALPLTLSILAVLITTGYLIPNTVDIHFSDFLFNYISRFTNYADANWYSAHVLPRFFMGEVAIEIISKSFLIGHGLGYMFEIPTWSTKAGFVDSSFLTIWIKLGIIGLILLSRILIQISKQIKFSFVRFKGNSNVVIRIFYSSLMGNIIVFSTLFFTNSFFTNSTATLPFLILFGATMGYNKHFSSN